MGDYDPKKDFGAQVRFYQGLLQKADTQSTHIDSQVNILIGIALAMFAFSAPRIQTLEFAILSLFAIGAVLCGFLAVHPPRFMRKRGQAESLMYNKRVSEFNDSDAYDRALRKVAKDPEDVRRQFAIEIYNLYRYYYRPKRVLHGYARNLLVAGIITTAVFHVARMLGWV